MAKTKYKIFAINLERSESRWKAMRVQLERLGLPYERFSAVDGREMSDEVLRRHYSAELNRCKYYVDLSRSEIACYISHLRACEKIISEELDFGIILEDDIVLKDGFQMVPQVLSDLKEKWNYIKLIAPGKKKKINERIQVSIPIRVNIKSYLKDTNSTNNEKIIETASIGVPAMFELITWNEPPIGTSAYAITLDGAKEFLSKRSKFFRPIDVDLQYEWETSLKIQGLRPFFLDLIRDKSTIQTCKLGYHYPLARLVYKLKYAIASILFHK